MTMKSLRGRRGIRSAIYLSLLTMLIAAVDMRAQRFEAAYGDANVGAGWRVYPTAGGYIAMAIATNTVNATSDIYLVKLDFTGAVVWSNSYDINGQWERPHGLTVCGNGDIAVVGQTFLPPGTGPADIFLIRVDANGVLKTDCGGVPAAYIYGNPDPDIDDNAWEVIEAKYSDPSGGPAIQGDLVICGSTGWLQGGADSYMLRVSPCGLIRWSWAYINSRNDEELYDLTEANTGPNADRGDIIAVGYSRSYGPGGGGLIMRVNGFTGLIGFAPEGSHVVMDVDAELSEFHAVVELQTAPNAGQIVAAGRRTQGGAVWDIYARKTMANPCIPLFTDGVFSDVGGALELAWDIREVLAPGMGSPNLTPGNLVMTGSSQARNPGGEAFLLETDPNLVIAGSGYNLYGNQATVSYGMSLWPVYNSGGVLPGDPTNGFVIAGNWVPVWTTPPYLRVIKTDAAGSSGCSDPWSITASYPPPRHVCTGWNPEYFPQIATLTPTSVQRPGSSILCFSWTKPATPGASLTDMKESSVEAVPNPVWQGRDLELMVTLDEAAEVHVTVIDASGRTVVQRTERLSSGENRFSMSTEGWAVGTYFVQIANGDNVQQKEVVIIR